MKHPSMGWAGLLAAAVVLGACDGNGNGEGSLSAGTTTSAGLPSTVPTTSGPPPPTSSTTAPLASLIAADAIGPLRVGMTLGAMKGALGTGWAFSSGDRLMVDFDAISVSRAGETHFLLVYPAHRSPLGDGDVVAILMTEHTRYRTAEGVGAGSRLADAEGTYGEATLSFSFDNEGREGVRFERHPFPRVAFRPKSPTGQRHAGVYPQPLDTFNQTTDYEGGTTIDRVTVTCAPEVCPV